MPYLTPNSVPEDDICRPLFIPDDPIWFAIFSGALTELGKDWNWEQSSGGLSIADTLAVVNAVLERYYGDPCGGGCRRIYRVGVGGLIELSDDGGETWHSASEEIPTPEPRLEPTMPDKLCLGSANAANVLHQTYLELLDAYATDSAIQYGIGAFLAVFGLVVSGWLGAPLLIINGLIGFAIDAFAAVYGLGAQLAIDDWTEETTESLVCLLQRYASIDGEGAIRFNYQAVRDNLSELNADPTVVLWLFYILWIIGVEALDAAGATTAIASWDCSNCDGSWDVFITPDNIQNMTNARFEFTWRPVYTCTDTLNREGRYSGVVEEYQGVNVWATEFQSSSTVLLNIAWRLTIPLGSTVTEIRPYWSNRGGAVNPVVKRVRFGSNPELCNPNAAATYWTSGTLSESGVLYDVTLQVMFNQERYGHVPYLRVFGTGINPFV